VSAVLAYVHPGTVRAEFMSSVLAMMRDGRTRLDAVLTVQSGPNISRARNELARKFLADTRAPWLFMADTDMVFAPDALDRLIAAADPAQRPVVGALCFAGIIGGVPVPTMYDTADRGGQQVFVPRLTWPEDKLVQVTATGAACLLIHRHALQAIAKDSGETAAPWFRESVTGAALIGEDLPFCLRAAAAGIPVHVHTGVQAGHVKTTMLGKVT
jgi:GT2 family glycosyltransferase